ncbi:PqqD family protein [Hymenobacter siberiensis]|uniref:PqqD family protein n=1 Tax=Hymenobacter siberiensis TaxID=2848396 RepID=UPI001C1DF482|nr:PqqD family protein [Hymenobacter siberiensis]MBU6120740.1 PqqD family protein [Hymenobacter siberiensis]
MKLKPNIATSEAGFIFNPATGDSFAANPLAADILARAKAGLDAAAIKAGILECYDVAPGQLEKDWDDLLAQLRDFNLLVEAGSEEQGAGNKK